MQKREVTQIREFTEEQLAVIAELKELDIYHIGLTPEMSASDLRYMYKYAILGQDYLAAINHYDTIKDSVNAYLGALYVGVPEDNSILLAFISRLQTDGLPAEDRIDKLKQEAAYRYLYGSNGNNIPTDMLYYIWSACDGTLISTNEMSKQELQFWWELIPSKEYRNIGTISGDILAYLYK
jgi:hypothetical protein